MFLERGHPVRMSAKREKVDRAAQSYMKRSNDQNGFAALAARCL